MVSCYIVPQFFIYHIVLTLCIISRPGYVLKHCSWYALSCYRGVFYHVILIHYIIVCGASQHSATAYYIIFFGVLHHCLWWTISCCHVLLNYVIMVYHVFMLSCYRVIILSCYRGDHVSIVYDVVVYGILQHALIFSNFILYNLIVVGMVYHAVNVYSTCILYGGYCVLCYVVVLYYVMLPLNIASLLNLIFAGLQTTTKVCASRQSLYIYGFARNLH